MSGIVFHIKERGGLREVDRSTVEGMISTGKLPPDQKVVSVDGGRTFMTASDALAIEVLDVVDIVVPDSGTSVWGYFIKCLRKYITFNGRASRKEFLSFLLIRQAVFLALLIAIIFTGGVRFGLFFMMVMFLYPLSPSASFVSIITISFNLYSMYTISRMGVLRDFSFSAYAVMTCLYLSWSLITIIPFLAVTCRRYHDTNKGLFSHLIPGLLIVPTVLSLNFAYILFNAFGFPLGSILPIVSIGGLLCVIGGTIIFLKQMSRRGKPGVNKYGPSLKDRL